MPLAEHPVDESWGYQVSGFFSATSRYGTPAELAELINKLHLYQIGVIMDFVPVHLRWIRTRWPNLTERHCTSIRAKIRDTPNGAAGILIITAAKCGAFFSRPPISD